MCVCVGVWAGVCAPAGWYYAAGGICCAELLRLHGPPGLCTRTLLHPQASTWLPPSLSASRPALAAPHRPAPLHPPSPPSTQDEATAAAVGAKSYNELVVQLVTALGSSASATPKQQLTPTASMLRGGSSGGGQQGAGAVLGGVQKGERCGRVGG